MRQTAVSGGQGAASAAPIGPVGSPFVKKIEAVFHPDRFPAVKERLAELGAVDGLTVCEVRGAALSSHRLKIELIVGDRQARRVVDALLLQAQPGDDGHLTVMDIAETLPLNAGRPAKASSATAQP